MQAGREIPPPPPADAAEAPVIKGAVTASPNAGPGRRGPLLDAGWLFLLAGVALLASTVLIPAQRDLEEARFYLKRAQIAEEHRLARMSNYASYLGMVADPDEQTLTNLVATQLNKAPQGMTLLASDSAGSGTQKKKPAADVYASLEPPPLVLPEKPERGEPSRLERWATEDSSRLWLIAAGVMCVLVGILPPSREV